MSLTLFRRPPAWSVSGAFLARPVRWTPCRRQLAASCSAEPLVDWVTHNGGAVSGVAIGREGQQGYGLIATQASVMGRRVLRRRRTSNRMTTVLVIRSWASTGCP